MASSLIDSVQDKTIDTVFRETVSKFPQNTFIAVPPARDRDYYQSGFELSYVEALKQVDLVTGKLMDAGYGVGDRVSLALDNRPEHIIYKLALNSIGISCVPVNPDYRSTELSYLLEHSDSVLIIYLKKHEEKIIEAQRTINKSIKLPNRKFLLARSYFYSRCCQEREAFHSQSLQTARALMTFFFCARARMPSIIWSLQ